MSLSRRGNAPILLSGLLAVALLLTPAFRLVLLSDGDEPFQWLILADRMTKAVETAFGAIVLCRQRPEGRC
jgi:hypothetical protein